MAEDDDIELYQSTSTPPDGMMNWPRARAPASSQSAGMAKPKPAPRRRCDSSTNSERGAGRAPTNTQPSSEGYFSAAGLMDSSLDTESGPMPSLDLYGETPVVNMDVRQPAGIAAGSGEGQQHYVVAGSGYQPGSSTQTSGHGGLYEAGHPMMNQGVGYQARHAMPMHARQDLGHQYGGPFVPGYPGQAMDRPNGHHPGAGHGLRGNEQVFYRPAIVDTRNPSGHRAGVGRPAYSEAGGQEAVHWKGAFDGHPTPKDIYFMDLKSSLDKLSTERKDLKDRERRLKQLEDSTEVQRQELNDQERRLKQREMSAEVKREELTDRERRLKQREESAEMRLQNIELTIVEKKKELASVEAAIEERRTQLRRMEVELDRTRSYAYPTETGDGRAGSTDTRATTLPRSLSRPSASQVLAASLSQSHPEEHAVDRPPVTQSSTLPRPSRAATASSSGLTEKDLYGFDPDALGDLSLSEKDRMLAVQMDLMERITMEREQHKHAAAQQRAEEERAREEQERLKADEEMARKLQEEEEAQRVAAAVGLADEDERRQQEVADWKFALELSSSSEHVPDQAQAMASGQATNDNGHQPPQPLNNLGGVLGPNESDGSTRERSFSDSGPACVRTIDQIRQELVASGGHD